MIRNYLKIAWRNVWKNKTFSFINVVGLALGMAVFLLIMEYVAFEYSANRFHKNYTSLYRGRIMNAKGEGDFHMAPGIGPAVKSSFPEVDAVTRIADGIGNGVVTLISAAALPGAVTSFREENVSYVDGNFFDVFSFPLIAGNASLQQPLTMAVSAATAQKYFGKGNAVGQTLKVNNQFGNAVYTVTAVYQNMPEQSDIKADILLSYPTLNNPAMRNGNAWADPAGTGSEYVTTFLKINPDANANLLASKITDLMHRIAPQNKDAKLGLQPLRYLHLAPGFNYNFPTYGSLIMVFSFLAVALLILVIAWVNYINLTTAQVLQRAKEAGVRKVLGANRWQIVALQLTETGLMTAVSIILAMLIVCLLQPLYNEYTGKIMSWQVLTGSWAWLACLVLVLCSTLAAGGYVAWILSSFNPVKTIRDKAVITIGGVSLRRGLTVLQFTISVVFVIATFTLYRQLHFMQQQDLGFQPAQLVAISGPAEVNGSKTQLSTRFKNELSRLPFVQKVAASNNIPGQGYNFATQGITRLNAQPGEDKHMYNMLIVDNNYFDTYQIKLLQGTGFSDAVIQKGWSGTRKVIINEAAALQLGFKPGEVLTGKKIKWGNEFQIVGVAKNYNHLSLHTLVQPVIFLPSVADGYFTVKLDTHNMSSHIAAVQHLYQQLFPGEPFQYAFIDEVFGRQYQAEQRMGRLFMASAGIAICIACLGLFGLAAYAARRRTKEIGIRKVLGAGVTAIAALLSADFIKLVLLAVVIASPLAWFIMHRWLQNFAYRINQPWWMFVLAGTFTAAVALLTISFQSVRAALANPVKSLRSE